MLASPPGASQARHTAADRGFTIALTGDAIITRRLSEYAEPQFLDMIELVRGADVAFTNLEVLLHDYEPYPAHRSGGTWMRADPGLIHELMWAGFDLVSLANNHTGDYGVEGMRLTVSHVEEAGLVHAGVGESLAEAREAKFVEISGARVALVSVASTFTEHSRAGRARGDMRARPGLNPLRHSTTRIVTADQMERFRRMLTEMDLERPLIDGRLRVFGNWFEVGDEPGVRTAPHEVDQSEIAAVVSNASRLSDYTIVSLHAHERAGPNSVPADFIVTFARAMITAGADVVVGHGPHVLRGIEIYQGKPIFYSLGDFMFQNETLLRLPHENYEPYGLGPENHVADFNDARYDMDRRGFPSNREVWESVIAMVRWEDEDLVELALHPISLGWGTPRWERGRPMLAGVELAEKIIEDLRIRSEKFGTQIALDNGIGLVELR
jgi:poly-gamma-glutamate synthesis protein (capsule biosynthesis protein)